MKHLGIPSPQAYRALRAVTLGLCVNLVLSIAKISGGIYGNSYALIADGIESGLDIFSSLIVLFGLKISLAPADESHPYGHGKAESLSTIAVALLLLGSAVALTVHSIGAILRPEGTPAPFTLIILLGVMITKDILARFVGNAAHEAGSTSVEADAWHHKSDLLTSAAAFVGISIAIIGGEEYHSADAYAALFASAIIAFNGGRMLWKALHEIMDSSAPLELQARVRALTKTVEGVMDVDDCRIRKSGLGYLVDIHVIVDGALTVRDGHEVARAVRKKLSTSAHSITDALVHIEPFEKV